MNTRELIEFIGRQPLARFDPYRFAVEIAAAQKEACAVALEEAGHTEQATLVRALE